MYFFFQKLIIFTVALLFLLSCATIEEKQAQFKEKNTPIQTDFYEAIKRENFQIKNDTLLYDENKIESIYKKFISKIAAAQEESLRGKFVLPQDKTPCALQTKKIRKSLIHIHKDLPQTDQNQAENIKNQLCKKGWAVTLSKQSMRFTYYYTIFDVVDDTQNASAKIEIFVSHSFDVKENL